MKNIKKYIKEIVAIIVEIAMFIGISIYCEKMHSSNSLIGGWVASLIISWLVYLFGIKPTIMSINSISINKIAFSIAKKFMSVVSTNEEKCKKQQNKNEIESKVVSMLFPKTNSCVEKFYSQYCNLFAKHQNKDGTGVSWPTFASFDSIIDDNYIDAKEFKILQSKFKEEITESVFIDLFVSNS